jgi:hypothetical protein
VSSAILTSDRPAALWPQNWGKLANQVLGLPLIWVVAAVAVRVALAPLQHTWDSQTWFNVMAELGSHANPVAAIQAPFDTAQRMTDLARAAQEPYYEYWAYPPGMLFVWWPLARLWTLLAVPLTVHFAFPNTFTAAAMPPLLSVLMKLPVMTADLVSAALLARMGHPTLARWFLFNPYVLLVSLWTFDGVMLALLLGGLFAAEQRRWGLSGALMGVGTVVKFVPALVVPAAVLWALRVSPRPLRSAFAAGAAALGTFVALCLPWRDGVLYTLGFHGGRVGGGMSWQGIWAAMPWIDPLRDVTAIRLSMSGQIGMLTLSGAMIVALLVIWWRRLGLLESALVLLLAYLVGSKLVNEVYALPAMAVAALIACRRGMQRWALVSCLWVIPLLFAVVNVPIWGFAVAPAEALGWLTAEQVRYFHDGYLVTYQQLAPALVAAGAAFQLMCMWGIAATARLRPETA